MVRVDQEELPQKVRLSNGNVSLLSPPYTCTEWIIRASTDRDIRVAVDAVVQEDLVDLFVAFLYVTPVAETPDI